eukprot:Opistho-2@34827
MVQFVTFIVLLNTLVPISLYVSLEFIRIGQSLLINWDVLMYDEHSDTPTHCRTTTLSEELGMIQYVFSDKTGTLTRNVMTFVKCTIGGIMYDGSNETTAEAAAARVAAEVAAEAAEQSGEMVGAGGEIFRDKELLSAVKGSNPKAAEFFRLLSLCHTALPDADPKTGKVVYHAQSPDEGALVTAAREFGFEFKGTGAGKMTIVDRGQTIVYELLHIIEFDSDRKRMSVILRDPSGKYLLLTKGADSVIYERLASKDDELQRITGVHLSAFATDGLRTLVLASRVIPDAEYTAWDAEYRTALVSMDERERKVKEVGAKIEHSLVLLGASAVEDKLQAGVPETIANLAKANIKIWMLTGDKQETAINIGYACRLLTNDMDLLIINATTKDQTLQQIRAYLERVALVKETRACIIDGPSLVHGLNEDVKAEFIRLATQCSAVIACRVTPLQKALLVELVKKSQDVVTLAIGDGANDVGMIQAAHIGIGISGQEGRQAVLASDFSFAQFRFLERLLLVHGRWSYVRIAKFLQYFFYKNFAMTLCQFWFSFFSGHSGSSIYDTFFLTFYNVFFSSLPIIILGIFDKDLSDQVALRHPGLYVVGQKQMLFNFKVFWMSLANGAYMSLVLYFVTYGSFYDVTNGKGVAASDQTVLGVSLEAALVLTVNLMVGLDTYNWTILNHISVWGSVVFWWLFTLATQALWTSFTMTYYGALYAAMGTAPFWFNMFLCPVVCLLPVYIYRAVTFNYAPNPIEIVRHYVLARRSEAGDDIPLTQRSMSTLTA